MIVTRKLNLWTMLLREQPGEPSGGNPAPEPAPAPEPEPTPEPAAADYSFLPEAYRQDDTPDIAGFRAHYDEVVARDAQRQEALADVPEDASGYKFTVPEKLDLGELDLPENFSIGIDTESPHAAGLFQELGSMLHEMQIPASAAERFMGLLGKYEAGKYAETHSRVNAERQALGPAADSRMNEVKRLVEARVPKAVLDKAPWLLESPAAVPILEKLLATRTMPAPTPTPGGAGDENLSATERLQRANRKAAQE